METLPQAQAEPQQTITIQAKALESSSQAIPCLTTKIESPVAGATKLATLN